MIGDFLDEHSGIDLEMDVSNKTQVIQDLSTNQLDFAIVSVLPDGIEVEEELLFENRLFLVSNGDSKSENVPLIYREEGSATRAAMISYLVTNKKNAGQLP